MNQKKANEAMRRTAIGTTIAGIRVLRLFEDSFLASALAVVDVDDAAEEVDVVS